MFREAPAEEEYIARTLNPVYPQDHPLSINLEAEAEMVTVAEDERVRGRRRGGC